MSDTEEKNKPASGRKLQKQREEGSLAQATEAGAFIASACAIMLLSIGAATGLALIHANFAIAFDIMTLPLNAAINSAGPMIARNILAIVLPVVVIMVGVGLLSSLIYNRGPTFVMKAVAPQLSRVSITSGFKRVYGRRGWIESGVATFRITLWLGAMFAIGWLFLPEILNVYLCGYPCIASVSVDLLALMAAIAVIIFLVFAGLDMLIQKSLFLEEQKMTESEVKRENKEQAGNPEIRKERRQRMRDGAKGAGSIGAHRANMCFFSNDIAVGIRYHPKHAPMPRIAARASSPNAVAELRRSVASHGFPELYHPGVVALCRSAAPGEAVPEAAFGSLAEAMGEIFKGTS